MVNIIQGSIKSFTVLLKKLSNGEPFPLAGVTEISTCFHNADGTELMLTKTGGEVTVLDAAIGKIQIDLTDVQTALLGVDENLTLEIATDFGAGPIKCQIPSAYSVIQTEC